MLRIGEYPPEYDRAKHGPYDPARYYGKPDTPFGQVKLGELKEWISRRDMGPRSFMALCSRGFWRWQHKYIHPRKSGIAPYFQLAVGGSIIFYMLNYLRIRGHRNYKYH
ncbi:ATP synthase, subunit F [Nomia melanderi]|uniref:ATP synthase, subunit F n=1 Tax=Nomia melanderi TaxID=2448451 RepID=UPI0013041F3C|nr:putative ATP synthase subunit f, mitochondrial [Nomia melanderi]